MSDSNISRLIGKPWKKTLLKKRSGVHKLYILYLSLFLLFVSVVVAGDWGDYFKIFVTQLCVLAPLILILEILNRFCLFLEERNYFTTRYNNDIGTLLNYFLYFPKSFYIIFTIWFITFCINLNWIKNPFVQWHQFGVFSNSLSLISGFLISRIFNLDSGPLRESLWISNSNGLDYGSGMAYSFFYGYLKLVIQKTGGNDPHLEELMKVYEDREGVKLACYRLFILIPKSLHCPPSLQDSQSPSIEESKSLFEKLLDVAGVKGRSYRNSVYKIREKKNKKVFVAAEYATPLKTFREVINNSGDHSDVYRRHKNEIALQFYKTLKKIINSDPAIEPYCELIYYNDIKCYNGNREIRHDVGEILLHRINKIKKNV